MRRLLIVAVFLMIVIWKTPVLAADLSEITENMVLETGVDAKLYEEASDKSELVASLVAGTVVFTVEDAREITETLLANRTVVLNLEGLDVDIAQRIIDFTSGSCFAISGNLQKISHYIFIITPSTVDISGDFLSLVDNFQGRGLHSDFSL